MARRLQSILGTVFAANLLRANAQLLKILCLHGGGQSASNFQAYSGMQSLMAQLSSRYEFVFAASPEPGNVWIRDAPGGKAAGTTDPGWADTSVTYLNDLRRTHGPFAGILGYSQGAAFAIYYLSRVQSSSPFEFAMLFCGYLPTVHRGLIDSIDAQSPFGNISALVFMGARDFIISNSMTSAAAAKFASPQVVTSSSADHHLPAASDPTFTTVKDFAVSQADRIGGGGSGVQSSQTNTTGSAGTTITPGSSSASAARGRASTAGVRVLAAAGAWCWLRALA